MNVTAAALTCFHAGIFASAIAVILTAPPRYLLPAFLCGFAGRLARDVAQGLGMGPNWATGCAAAVVVLVAVLSIRRHLVSPVVLVTGVLPIGAALATFHAIIGLMKVSTLEGAALDSASAAMVGHMGKAFTTSMAIALGLGAGMAVVRLFRRGEGWEGV